MILENETLQQFGYKPQDLTKGSHKLVVNKCDDCGKIRLSQFKMAYNHCKSCGKRGIRSANYGRKFPSEMGLKISRKLKEMYQNGEVAHWAKGLTKETDERIAKSSIKRQKPRINFKPWNYGMTSKDNPKICAGKNHPNYHKHHSDETKNKLSESHKGKKLNHKIDCNCCICKAKRGELVGENNPMYGKTWTEESKRKMSMIQRHLEYNEDNWIGYSRKKRSNKIINWRNAVYKRDNFTCQYCHDRGRSGYPVVLNSHHIKSWKDYPDDRFKIENGICLCVQCHKHVHKSYHEKECLIIDKVV